MIVARVLVLSHISFVLVHKFGVLHKQWKTIEVRMQLTCTGGMLGKKQELIDAARHPITHGTFVKMTNSDRWLQRMVTGFTGNTCLASTTLLRTLVNKTMASRDHGNGPPSDQDDPMNELVYDDAGNSPPDANASRASATASRIPTNAILEVTMPELCQTGRVHCDGKTRSVKLWYRGKRCLWIAQEDIEWAVSYMRVELDTRCVLPPSDSADCQQVAEVRWDFSRGAWSMTKLGQEPTFFAPTDLQLDDMPSDYKALGSSSVQAYFETLSYDDKKELAREALLRLTR